MISIVIPTRDRPSLLRQALDAVLVQTCTDTQLIVVDDSASPDHAATNAELVRSMFVDARYVRLTPSHKDGSGPSSVRNVGVELAEGELIAFCDDDDYWCEPRYLERGANAFAANESLDLLFCNQQAHRDGQPAYDVWLPELDNIIRRRSVAADSVTEVSRRDCLLTPGRFAHLNTCVFRRQLLLSIGGFWDGVRFAEDMDVFVRSVDAARRIAFLDATVAVHNIPERSQRRSASSVIDGAGKVLSLNSIGGHLNQVCTSPEALNYARRVAGEACRDLALLAAQSSRYDTAHVWAKLGLSWHATVKWRAYTLLLACYAALARIRM